MFSIIGGVCLAGIILVIAFVVPSATPIQYEKGGEASVAAPLVSYEEEEMGDEPIYIPTPQPLKAIYMTQCVVGTPSFREKLFELARSTEINSIIIDVKDYTGSLGFEPKSENLKPFFGTHCYAPDMKEFIRTLNEEGIYVIARITVFQDPLWAEAHTHLAVQKASDRSIWTDKKGLHFVDVGAQEFWDYIIEISKEAYDLGFDELNYDYVRYPSDGPMSNIYYPVSEKRIVTDPEHGKALQLKDFFAYLREQTQDLDIPISADLFGMVTTNTDDLNIGQVLEYALPYFDYIAPMVYPSHYPSGFNGWDNPNTVPHEIIEYAMTSAVERVKAFDTATTTPQEVRDHVRIEQLRPWIQDFDYGGNYGVAEVRTQIEAVYDSGLTSWMIWDPANRYTRDALLVE